MKSPMMIRKPVPLKKGSTPKTIIAMANSRPTRTAFSMAPIEPQDASVTLSAKTAWAQPGGKGKGKGKSHGPGQGRALGHGDTDTTHGMAHGHSGQKSANGRALGHEINGVSGVDYSSLITRLVELGLETHRRRRTFSIVR